MILRIFDHLITRFNRNAPTPKCSHSTLAHTIDVCAYIFISCTANRMRTDTSKSVLSCVLLWGWSGRVCNQPEPDAKMRIPEYTHTYRVQRLVAITSTHINTRTQRSVSPLNQWGNFDISFRVQQWQTQL